MQLTSPKYFRTTETVTFLVVTLWGIAQGWVTVFYLIYLFWFQELIRTFVDTVYAYKNGKENGAKPTPGEIGGSFLLHLMYLVFIVVLFGIMLNWNNLELLAINMRTLLLRNPGFDLNILLFAAQYIFYRRNAGKKDLDVAIFNKGQIILHISIIVGALIQMGFVKRHPEYFSGRELWGSALVVLPFLLLKIWVNRKLVAYNNVG